MGGRKWLHVSPEASMHSEQLQTQLKILQPRKEPLQETIQFHLPTLICVVCSTSSTGGGRVFSAEAAREAAGEACCYGRRNVTSPPCIPQSSQLRPYGCLAPYRTSDQTCDVPSPTALLLGLYTSWRHNHVEGGMYSFGSGQCQVGNLLPFWMR